MQKGVRVGFNTDNELTARHKQVAGSQHSWLAILRRDFPETRDHKGSLWRSTGYRVIFKQWRVGGGDVKLWRLRVSQRHQ